ncbi:3-oxoadipate CoA-transferase alpha subunit [Antricoccus suffuscus]|uniref:3-oxoadipate CoA-transferase alpha subunit n=1 Tax=Antricoccus suffuscus TaxID=1629062 RepID=A0A2T1A6D5_9ACTN|nr:3-oxoacid CoA-transferase subunit A [Antricoccus suffuscus]PRZ44175.1 3-oxoadipate CoA-transferase alpha subunit [Antricoccus suffuscus]
MIDKRVASLEDAVAGISDGATILVGGFGDSGVPTELVDAVLDLGVADLTIVTNNGGAGDNGVAALIREKRVAKLICSYPRTKEAHWFKQRWAEGQLELELVPQGTMSERMRAAGAGLGGFFTPTGADTELAKGKETRMINGRLHVLEDPLPGDVSLVHAQRADRWGNLTYHSAARNFGPTMVTAGKLSVVQVHEFVELGDLDPEHIITPGIFVDRVVKVGSK